MRGSSQAPVHFGSGLLNTFLNLLPAVLLKFPVTVIQRTHLASLQPSGDAMEVEGMLDNVRIDLSTPTSV